MPKSRLPYEVWFRNVRPIVWNRDKRKCVQCNKSVSLNKCHIDHIKAGIVATNKLSELRTLCKKCHALRTCFLHRGLSARGVEEGIIPPKWRHLTWDEDI